MGTSIPFHLAFPVTDLAATRKFYGKVLGCKEARSAPTWVDFNLYGHQLSAHLVERLNPVESKNQVDGDAVPVRHFGCVLPWEQWEALATRLEEVGVACTIGPRIRFVGQPGEQGTLFLLDPDGHALEFKSFRDPVQLFAT